MGRGADSQLERRRLDRRAGKGRREDRVADRGQAERGGRGRLDVGQHLQAAVGGGEGEARAARRAVPGRRLPHRRLHGRGARGAGSGRRAARGRRRGSGGRHRRFRRRRPAQPRPLQDGRAVGHGRSDRPRPRRRRPDRVGLEPCRRGHRGRSQRLRRGHGGGLRLQVPQRRAWRAGLPVRRRAAAWRADLAPDGLDGTRGGVRLRADLPPGAGRRAVHEWDAQRARPAGVRGRGRSGDGGDHPRRRGQGPRPVVAVRRADGGAVRARSASNASPPPTAPRAAATSPMPTRRATPSCAP